MREHNAKSQRPGQSWKICRRHELSYFDSFDHGVVLMGKTSHELYAGFESYRVVATIHYGQSHVVIVDGVSTNLHECDDILASSVRTAYEGLAAMHYDGGVSDGGRQDSLVPSITPVNLERLLAAADREPARRHKWYRICSDWLDQHVYHPLHVRVRRWWEGRVKPD